MNTAELKIDLISRIANLKDIAVMEQIKSLLDVEKGESYQLNSEQKERISLGRAQLKNKQTVSHEDLQQEISKWLDTK